MHFCWCTGPLLQTAPTSAPGLLALTWLNGELRSTWQWRHWQHTILRPLGEAGSPYLLITIAPFADRSIHRPAAAWPSRRLGAVIGLTAGGADREPYGLPAASRHKAHPRALGHDGKPRSHPVALRSAVTPRVMPPTTTPNWSTPRLTAWLPGPAARSVAARLRPEFDCRTHSCSSCRARCSSSWSRPSLALAVCKYLAPVETSGEVPAIGATSLG